MRFHFRGYDYRLHLGFYGRWFGADRLIQRNWWGIHFGPVIFVAARTKPWRR